MDLAINNLQRLICHKTMPVSHGFMISYDVLILKNLILKVFIHSKKYSFSFCTHVGLFYVCIETSIFTHFLFFLL